MEPEKLDECSLKVQNFLRALTWCRNEIASCAAVVSANIGAADSHTELELGGGPYLPERAEKTDGAMYVSAQMPTRGGSLELYVGTLWSTRSWHVVGEIRLLVSGGGESLNLWRDERRYITDLDVLARHMLSIKESLLVKARGLTLADIYRQAG